ncbi:MAG: 23S rRNA pseudouridine(2604) synthase RluF [Bacteroidetes bacterium]|nr:23S rRNA pseudouridine(2604) synthase RluF [Bacteroidota bacterium]
MRNKSGRQIHNDSISLNKYISDTGFCSRREADDYIAQGRVTINHELSEMGNRVFEGDVVEIDGEPIKKKVKTIYLACHKPRGITSTTDQKDKTNIIDFIGHKQRIFPIGRLDKESEGLIFLTNDGNIVNKILRAGNNHEKEYLVTVDKPITPEFVRQMSEGVRIIGAKTKPCKVVEEGKQVFRITLTQGLNRQIRRMCDALDYKVKKLLRVRIMNVHLGKLPEGHWRYLTDEEVAMINRMVTESSKTQEASRIKASKNPISKDIEKQKTDSKIMVKDSSSAKPKKPASFKEYRKRKNK